MEQSYKRDVPANPVDFNKLYDDISGSIQNVVKFLITPDTVDPNDVTKIASNFTVISQKEDLSNKAPLDILNVSWLNI